MDMRVTTAGGRGGGAGSIERPGRELAGTAAPHEPAAIGAWMAVLDLLDCGVVVVGTDGRLHPNREARAQLADAGFALRLQGGELCAHDPGDTLRLAAAIHEARERHSRRLLHLQGPDGGLTVAVAPASDGDEGPAAVVLATGRRRLCPALTLQWFCSRHRLTPAESAVLESLLAGCGPTQIAHRHGTALSTVRSQIAAIKGKTATHGLRELMLRAAALPSLRGRV